MAMAIDLCSAIARFLAKDVAIAIIIVVIESHTCFFTTGGLSEPA